MTAAAFWRFREARVDVMVLEVGLGGRLDATNVSDPLVSAIVSLDFDHEAFLGRTLRAIAREKAGVMRRGRAVVLGPLPREARDAIAGAARRVGARRVEARGRQPTSPCPVRPPLAGAHQRDNLRVALRVLEEARSAGLPVRPRPRGSAGSPAPGGGAACSGIPGRPPLLLDGAHNPAGARALGALPARGRALRPPLRRDGRQGRAGAWPASCSPSPAPSSSRGRAWAARPRPRTSRRRTRGLARRVRREADVRKALALARRLARPGDTVVVAGSLYLVGEVLALRRPRKWSRASGRSHSATPR